MPLETRNASRTKVPSLPFESLKNSILGESYDLSLVFIGERRAKKLNIAYREKDYVPDILSFPLSKSAGEIFICQQAARRKFAEFESTPPSQFHGNFREFLAFLFIHGLLHLNGMEHGGTMDKAEQRHFTQWQKNKQSSV